MGRALPLSLVACAAMLLGTGLGLAPRDAAAETRDVHAWIELDSMRPAVGCSVGLSVEVRESGVAVGSTEVGIALIVDDEVVAADRAVTDGDGLAYLAFDTSSTYAGADGWLDLTIAGAYVKGYSILPTDGGDCGSDGVYEELTATIPAVTVDASVAASDTGGFITYVQQRNLSCEYASLFIATSAWGNGISEYAFDEVVGYSPNPHWGYRGDITGWWGYTDDYGVYAEPLASALDAFGFYGDVFYGGGDASYLMSRLDNGIPTLVWIGLWGDSSHYEETDGSSYKLIPGMHVVVAYDYDDGGIYVSDPAVGATRYYTWGDFMYMWSIVDYMALGVSPY